MLKINFVLAQKKRNIGEKIINNSDEKTKSIA